ncbi:hypothetical protein [Streptosporangium sp. LJ11]|uniref:hypothetical protein n=1 Tax=Streptosporangium sp. LJ11 TaxID=3436927 RepID=UPI003F7A3530
MPTTSVNTDDLRLLYSRAADDPVARGDQVGDLTVAGFAFIADSASSAEFGDQVLVEGEEELESPPRRGLRSFVGSTKSVLRTGPSPVQEGDLKDRLESAPPFMRAAFELALSDMGEDGRFVGALLDDMAGAGHRAWLVGGAVRDLLAHGDATSVNDLDFTGTAGPGELCELAARRLRRMGCGDYHWRVSGRLVWSVSPSAPPQQRIMEYRPLDLAGFRFPAYGGNLLDDAWSRDFTVNALYYDPRLEVVIDPSGLGRTHLGATRTTNGEGPRTGRRVLDVLYRGDDPTTQACIIMRYLKFRLRWGDVDADGVRRWVDGLPAGLPFRIPEADWPLLLKVRDKCLPASLSPAEQLGLAEELRLSEKRGTVAEDLVKALQDRAG